MENPWQELADYHEGEANKLLRAIITGVVVGTILAILICCIPDGNCTKQKQTNEISTHKE